ncbi:MAG: hypothetical protein AAGB46_01880 [Verrucomicrobiota bacterium]
MSKAKDRKFYWGAFLKLRFTRISLREQGLLLLFVGVLLVIWLSAQLDRHAAMLNEIDVAHREAAEQDWTIEREEITQQEFDALIAEIDLEALPSRDEVNGGLDALLRKYGFQFSSDQPKTESGSPLSFHTYQMTIRKAAFDQLARFTEDIKTNFSYVSVRYIKMQVDPRNHGQIDASFELKSIEYTQ